MFAFHLELAQLWRCPVEWCAVWKGSVRACLEHLTEKHGGSTFFDMKNVARFFPPPLDCPPECLAPCPPTRCFGNRGGCPPIQRGGTSTGPLLSDLQGPISSPDAPGQCCSPPVVLRVPSHGHRPAHASENIDPVVRGASWSGTCGRSVFWGEPPMCGRRHVSFADKVTILGEAEVPVCSPEAELPPLILPVVVEDSSVTPVEELIELVPYALGSSLPPPPGFSPFSWPVNDGGIDVDELCSRIGVDCSPSLSPISCVCTDVLDFSFRRGWECWSPR